ncbi:hypothetical protein [Candidatus Methanocrinis natronophilus]|uniref:Uncharacterized protein n=1 Tax=Candidatus Methanocrinis natronophilus TaxID=3033396 RepID=A0ABT5X5I7_9EURY|nr:hypothetical protein [Candidatus Methanocrinis natronophilus]MDF0589965.1 hypothetical protein [Candidatus Methanocrinis natronophilus]
MESTYRLGSTILLLHLIGSGSGATLVRIVDLRESDDFSDDPIYATRKKNP